MDYSIAESDTQVNKDQIEILEKKVIILGKEFKGFFLTPRPPQTTNVGKNMASPIDQNTR